MKTSKINLARLNHILIPTTHEERDRWRRGRMGRLFRPLGFLYESVTAEGQLVLALALVAGAAGLDVDSADVYLLWSALFAAFVASIALGWAWRMPGVRVDVELPARVTVGEDITFTLVLHNDGAQGFRGVRTHGPFLPWDGRWLGRAPTLPALPPHAAGRAEIRARFAARGEHHLDPFRAATLVPLGLMLGPSVYSPGCRFVVVPRIARVTRVETPATHRHQPGGVALASRTGESMDLLGVRPYRPGDAVRDLHARSWARTGVPVVREYQQEYFSRIGIVLDTDRDAADPACFEAAISLAAGLVDHLSRGEALIDLLVVGDQVHDLTVGRSCGHPEQALDLLACVEPTPAVSSDALLARLAPHLPRLSCVIFVALAWDEGRGFFVERMRASGVVARTLLVTAEAAGPRAPAPGVVAVTAEAITRGERLVL